jgi:hypothetical protein
MEHTEAVEQFLLKGELDGRHDFVFSMLTQFTNLHRWEIVDELAKCKKVTPTVYPATSGIEKKKKKPLSKRARLQKSIGRIYFTKK